MGALRLTTVDPVAVVLGSGSEVGAVILDVGRGLVEPPADANFGLDLPLTEVGTADALGAFTFHREDMTINSVEASEARIEVSWPSGQGDVEENTPVEVCAQALRKVGGDQYLELGAEVCENVTVSGGL